jgi:PPOX class probable F420-dependent enzyme
VTGAASLLSPEAEAFVRDARTARLATVDESGSPHVVPVCFAYLADCAYIALDEKPKTVPVERLRRVRNILAHPSVQLLIDRWSEDWSQLAYVQLRGEASLLGGGPEHASALKALRGKYPQYRAMALDQAPMIRIAVDRAVVWGKV